MNIGNLLFSFDGRINRAKFWLGNLVLLLFGLLVFGAAAALVPWDQIMAVGPDGAPVADELGNPQMDFSKIPTSAWIVYGLGILAQLYMGFAIAVKRCHDRGFTGWMSLIYLIPFAGPIWALIALGIMEGEPGTNKWGPNPLANRA